MFELIAVLIVVTAIASYVNHRFLRLPFAIGVMSVTLAVSLGILALGQYYPQLRIWAESYVSQVDFDQALLHGMLGFLLFAGALEIKLSELAQFAIPIALLATLGVLISTVLIGGATWLVGGWLGYQCALINCLLFGALISPTDPIAVLGVLKQAGVPKSVEVKIAGESLFNDGVAVVVFLSLLQFATRGSDTAVSDVAWSFLRDAGGGMLFGLVLGAGAYWLMKSIDNYQVEILISLAVVFGGYAAAEHYHLSAPIAVVVAGLIVGNQGRSFAMSPTTAQNLDLFWEIIDEVLNGVLFALIGLELLIIDMQPYALLLGGAAIVLALSARFISVSVPASLVSRWQPLERGTLPILTWGGLRGGISVAMALSLPTALGESGMPDRELIVVMTYFVAVFSILVQGLTLSRLSRRWCCVDTGTNSAAATKN